jgi:hypothetical protein
MDGQVYDLNKHDYGHLNKNISKTRFYLMLEPIGIRWGLGVERRL